MQDPEPNWMTRLDVRILELLETVDIAVLPGTIAVNLQERTTDVLTRCHMLAEHGLVQRVEYNRKAIVLAPDGEDFLAGNLSNRDLGCQIQA